ncbi:hypothetical protein [Epilithonimonas xixisoli]|uniref:Uncharacterized protein n=1 Tax=Epilithonimonas xixisoli TaxID=1476462 RepID=A0A4R8I598_9FLAO|nr:hypothetical protein [Epilithonimonas xixisoli]TDX83160.1 hypothetical protein B0I22_3228 [Epilithonimonas xixisoli]
MKKILLVFTISLLFKSCSENKSNISITEKIKTPATDSLLTKKIDSSELTKYNSVKEMLEDANDFSIEQGTLKLINNDENDLKIQISKTIVKGELEKSINDIVKRDIVYVAFQAFAQTPINKITITSIPIDYDDKNKYYSNFKKTITVTREQANDIMENEFGTLDYSILFTDLNGIQVPSDDFGKLKFDNLDKVFKQLSN